MIVLGVGLFVITFIYGAFYIWKRETYKGLASLFTFVLFTSIALIFHDRLTEIGFGDFKATIQQATSDAKVISELKKDILEQSIVIDSVRNELIKTIALSNQLNKKVVEASSFVNDTYIKVKQQSENIRDKSNYIDTEITRFDSVLSESQNNLSELSAFTEFNTSVVAAQNNSRKAFDKVYKWAEDTTYVFKEQAVEVWYTIT